MEQKKVSVALEMNQTANRMEQMTNGEDKKIFIKQRSTFNVDWKGGLG